MSQQEYNFRLNWVRTGRGVIAWFLWVGTSAMAAVVEPNDTMDTATPAPFSLFFDGVVTELSIGDGPEGDLDVDMFAIVVPGNWPVPITLTALAVPDAPVDLMLRLFDAAGVEIAKNDDGNSFQPDVPAIYALLLSPGTYYLGVSSAENPSYAPNLAGSGRPSPGGVYNLYINGGSAPHPASVLEPNDTSATATWKGNGSFAVHGEYIGDNEFGRLDVDIFHIYLLTPARLDIKASSADGYLDPVVRVRNCITPLPTPTSKDICSLGSADDQSDGLTDATLSTAMFEPGDAFIMVSGSGNRAFDPAQTESGEPGSVGAYDLSVTVTPLSPASPDEPNDSILSATQTPLLIAGRPDSFSIDGFVGNGPYATLRGDRDFYEIRVVDESRVISADVETLDLGSTLVPVLVAYDRKGHVLGYADGSTSDSQAHLTLPAGCLVGGDGVQDNLVLMVMGIKQRLPNDPFDPLEADYYGRIGEKRVTDGHGSIGAYRLKVSSLPSGPDCSPEPNWGFAFATPAPIENGFYFCGGTYLGDTDCPLQYDDLDAWAIDVVEPAEMRVNVWACPSREHPTSVQLAILDYAGVLKSEAEFESLYYEPTVLSTLLNEPGRYYVAVSNYCANSLDEHFNQACSNCGGSPGFYDIAISLLPARARARSIGNATAISDSGTQSQDLFATQPGSPPTIVRLDPANGAVGVEIPLPEPRTGGLGGLAADAVNLFYLGQGRYPTLYRLDKGTGDVLDQYFMWVGSGYYSAAAMLGNELYLLDHRRRQVHVVDPFMPQLLQSLPIGSMNGITSGGGLAALPGPNRLYVADAFNTKSIYEIHPATGSLTGILESLDNRPTAMAALGANLFVADFRTPRVEVRDRTGTPTAELLLDVPVGMLAGFVASSPLNDFDDDGDVDLLDVMTFQTCFYQEIATGQCVIADFNHDGVVDLVDALHLGSSTTGP